MRTRPQPNTPGTPMQSREASVRPAARTNPVAHASGSAPATASPPRRKNPSAASEKRAPRRPRVLSDDACAVVYRPTQIADELRRENADDTLPRVLVVATGKTFKRVRADVADRGLTVVVPHAWGTADSTRTRRPPTPSRPSRRRRTSTRSPTPTPCSRLRPAWHAPGPFARSPHRLPATGFPRPGSGMASERVFTAGDPSRLAWGGEGARAQSRRDAAGRKIPLLDTLSSSSFTFPERRWPKRARLPAMRHAFASTLRSASTSSVDEGTFEEWDADMPDADPLSFAGYREKIVPVGESGRGKRPHRTGGDRGACAWVHGLEFSWDRWAPRSARRSRGSSIAHAREGCRSSSSARRAARMQEGLASAHADGEDLRAPGAPRRGGAHVSVLTDPTTGGVTPRRSPCRGCRPRGSLAPLSASQGSASSATPSSKSCRRASNRRVRARSRLDRRHREARLHARRASRTFSPCTSATGLCPVARATQQHA